MRAVQRVEGRAVVIDRRDIDTDTIIPAAWLKRVERTGFGAGLFEAWRADPGFEAVIAPSFADIFRGNSTGAGLVNAQADEDSVAALIAALAADPAARVAVDVAERAIAVPAAGFAAPFALPDYARWRLLEGLDDIAVTLRHADAIAQFRVILIT